MSKIKLSSLLSKENYIAPPLDNSVIEAIKAQTISQPTAIMGGFSKFFIPLAMLVIATGAFYHYSGSGLETNSGVVVQDTGQNVTSVNEIDKGNLDVPNTNYNPNVSGSYNMQGDNLLYTIKSFINQGLGILGLLCLIMMIRAGFIMITAKGDSDKHRKGYVIVKQTIFGLIFIGLAWLIISFLYRLISWATIFTY